MKLRLMRGGFMVLPLLMGVSAFAQSGAKHAMTFDDLIKMHRISGADISHNGKWVAYAVSNIWIASTDGSKSVQLTQGGKDNSPLWSPDGRTLGFLSSRDGSSQVYL